MTARRAMADRSASWGLTGGWWRRAVLLRAELCAGLEHKHGAGRVITRASTRAVARRAVRRFVA